MWVRTKLTEAAAEAETTTTTTYGNQSKARAKMKMETGKWKMENWQHAIARKVWTPFCNFKVCIIEFPHSRWVCACLFAPLFIPPSPPLPHSPKPDAGHAQISLALTEFRFFFQKWRAALPKCTSAVYPVIKWADYPLHTHTHMYICKYTHAYVCVLYRSAYARPFFAFSG